MWNFAIPLKHSYHTTLHLLGVACIDTPIHVTPIYSKATKSQDEFTSPHRLVTQSLSVFTFCPMPVFTVIPYIIAYRVRPVCGNGLSLPQTLLNTGSCPNLPSVAWEIPHSETVEALPCLKFHLNRSRLDVLEKLSGLLLSCFRLFCVLPSAAPWLQCCCLMFQTTPFLKGSMVTILASFHHTSVTSSRTDDLL